MGGLVTLPPKRKIPERPTVATLPQMTTVDESRDQLR
jgi:hypothetical protein